MMKTLVFRVDAGNEIGFGHAVRCISLAKHLIFTYGIKVVFYSSPNDNLEKLYRQQGVRHIFYGGLNENQFLEKIREENPDSVLFIDKLYAYTAETIRGLKSDLKIIMFHNECDGMFESDFAIFPSAHLDDEIIQDRRWKDSPVKFLYGPNYIVINEQYVKLVRENTGVNTQPYLAITTGASDPQGLLITIIKWINQSDLDISVKALYGFDFYQKDILDGLLPKLKQTIKVVKFNYKDLLSSYLVVSAVGVTTYELIFANIPVITIGHIKKNADAGEILQRRYGCNYHLGMLEDTSRDKFISDIKCLWNDKEALCKIREKQEDLIDGEGINRVAKVIYACCANK